jgi:hypothetical protein
MSRPVEPASRRSAVKRISGKESKPDKEQEPTEELFKKLSAEELRKLAHLVRAATLRLAPKKNERPVGRNRSYPVFSANWGRQLSRIKDFINGR